MFFSSTICGQKESKISLEIETDNHSNYGSIDTYDKITDGYSSTSQRRSIGIAFQLKTVGLRLSAFDLDLNGPGFENPFRLVWASYDDFPREWKKKGGSYSSDGYQFGGYSVGIFKVFKTRLFDIELNANYARFEVNVNEDYESNRLFLYEYINEVDFESRHWAYYEGGSYYSLGVTLDRRIWKGLNAYVGVNLRNGTFKYFFNEKVRDDLIVENNLDVMTQTDKKFNSFGLKIGLKYQFEFGRPYGD